MLPAALALLALLLVWMQPRPTHADDGEHLFDLGPRWEQLGSSDVHDIPVELLIAYFTDCDEAAGLSPPSCGTPPARWVPPKLPVEFCTLQAGRPPSVSAEEFRTFVADAAAAWNATLAAVGVDYTGDCPGGGVWQDDNLRNEIGFDDGRNVVSGQAVALTLGTWQSFFAPGSQTVVSREFVEADIILDQGLSLPDVCFASTITHEMGHALGFGHSDAPSDLMFPTFNPNNPSTCPLNPSSAETVQLRSLYGSNGAPTVSAGADRSVDLATNVTLAASGSDPEGSALTYQWVQTSGPTVTLSSGGAAKSVTFTSPASPSTLVFEVTASDQFFHTSSDNVTISVAAGSGAPSTSPVFDSFLPAAFVPGMIPGTTALGWTFVDGASSYEICSGPSPITLGSNCASGVADPSLAVTWDTIAGAGGAPDTTRVFTGGYRFTRIQACNSSGCSDAIDGPVAGGLRWSAWNIDYDFLAMSFDIAGFQFTFAAAINLSPTARQFELGNGPSDDPFQTSIGHCASVGPNGLCFAFLDYTFKDQGAVVGVRSSRAGTPTTEHHIQIR